MKRHAVVLLADKNGRKLVREKCLKHGFDINHFEDLVNLELEQVGKLRKRGMNERFDEILDVMDAESDAHSKN